MTRYATPSREPPPDLLVLIDAVAFTAYPALVAMFIVTVLTAALIRRSRQPRTRSWPHG